MNRRYAIVIGVAAAFVVGILLALSLAGARAATRRTAHPRPSSARTS